MTTDKLGFYRNYKEQVDMERKDLLRTQDNWLLTREERTAINNAMPPEAKYGEAFKEIAQAQVDKVKLYLSNPEVREDIANQLEIFTRSLLLDGELLVDNQAKLVGKEHLLSWAAKIIDIIKGGL